MFFSLMTRTQKSGLHVFAAIFPLFLLLVTAQPGLAQNVEFNVLMAGNDISCLMEVDGKVYGGLTGGGLVVWNADDPSDYEVWNSSSQLSGNFITDLAMANDRLWIATLDAGVTRVENLDTTAHFRQFSGNLGSKRITAITAAMIAGKEQAYYAMEGQGIGSIYEGLPGFVFTTLDGLLSDDINALQFFDGELFVASDLGISLFRDNLFTTQNTGLTNFVVNDLTLDSEGHLLAGGNGGVFRWDPLTEAWVSLGGLDSNIVDISTRSGEIWAVGNNDLGMYDGSSWSISTLPNTGIRTVSAGTDLWIAGSAREPGMDSTSRLVYLGRKTGDGTFEVWDFDSSLVRTPDGITVGADGDVWIGSYTADAISRYDGQNYSHIYEIGDEDNDFSGLFNHYGNFLCMATSSGGDIWAAQFGNGVLIIDPNTGAIQQVNHNATGMDGGRILNMVAHPDGSMILMHDRGQDALVDILVDPDNFDDDNNWLSLPRGLPGLGNGLDVYDALVERNDVIWFAVGSVGLVRWDINGDNLGPDDEITWLDTSDDRWYDPITVLPYTSADPKAAKCLALATDGTIWVGGTGVARFSYDENLGEVIETKESWGEKTSPTVDGLISGDVSDIALDRNGDLWVATIVGLNRVRKSGNETIIDVYMDVENYLSHPDYGILYSTNAIVKLPAGSYKDMAVSSDGASIAVSSDRGAALLHVSEINVGHGADIMANLYCYPNPFIFSEAEGGLKLGGLNTKGLGASKDYTDLAVEIYNLEGQLVYSHSSVEPGISFWSGVNRVGQPVVTGMYVVKVQWQGETAVCPLAVVR